MPRLRLSPRSNGHGGGESAGQHAHAAAWRQAIVACHKGARAKFRLPPKSVSLAGRLSRRLGETRRRNPQFRSGALEIRPDYDEAITKKISIWIFFPTRISRHNRRTRKILVGCDRLQMPRRKLASRPLDPLKRIVGGYVSVRLQGLHSAAFAFLRGCDPTDKANFQINCYSCSPARDIAHRRFPVAGPMFGSTPSVFR